MNGTLDNAVVSLGQPVLLDYTTNTPENNIVHERMLLTILLCWRQMHATLKIFDAFVCKYLSNSFRIVRVLYSDSVVPNLDSLSANVRPSYCFRGFAQVNLEYYYSAARNTRACVVSCRVDIFNNNSWFITSKSSNI